MTLAAKFRSSPGAMLGLAISQPSMAGSGYGGEQGRSTNPIWEGFPELLTIRLQETQWMPLALGTVHIWHTQGLQYVFYRAAWVN